MTDQALLEPVDPAALQRLRRFGGDKLVRDMAALFAEHAPGRLDVARASLAKGDAPGVKAALHSLKSSAGQVGATRMHRLCDEGEGIALGGDLAPIPALLQQLESDLPLVTAWLQESAGGEGEP